LVATLTDEETPERSSASPILQSGPGADSQILVAGAGWELVVDSDEALYLVKESGATSSVRGYARPPTLDEASSFAVPTARGVETLVAGPVSAEADVVRVKAAGGATAEAEPVSAYDFDWFWIELEGRVAVSEIQALDAAGDVVDERTLPTMPRPTRRVVRRAQAPQER
jgi:hypothetical protein